MSWIYIVCAMGSQSIDSRVNGKNYPEIPVPNEVPIPQPVDAYYKTWDSSK